MLPVLNCPSDPTGDILLELLRLDGAGVPTSHTGLQNNPYEMPNVAPGTESPLTSPCCLPLEPIPNSPCPTEHVSLCASFQPPCVKKIIDLDLNRHK